MKTSVRQIKAAVPAINRLLNAQMKMWPAYQLVRIAKLATEALEEFEKQVEEARQKFTSGEKDGRPIWKVKNSEELFEKEIKTAWEKPIDLPAKPIRLSEIADVKLSANDLVSLEWLFIDDLAAEGQRRNGK
jgi:hypothetical protein